MVEPADKVMRVGGVLKLVGRAQAPHPVRCPLFPPLPDSYPQWEEALCRQQWAGCPAPQCHPGPEG